MENIRYKFANMIAENMNMTLLTEFLKFEIRVFLFSSLDSLQGNSMHLEMYIGRSESRSFGSLKGILNSTWLKSNSKRYPESDARGTDLMRAFLFRNPRKAAILTHSGLLQSRPVIVVYIEREKQLETLARQGDAADDVDLRRWRRHHRRSSKHDSLEQKQIHPRVELGLPDSESGIITGRSMDHWFSTI